MRNLFSRLNFKFEDLKALAILLGLYFLQWHLSELDADGKLAFLGPWTFIHPKRIATLFFALCAVEIVAGFLNRVLGAKWGALFEGFLGGLVSSTAVAARVALKSLKLKDSAASVDLATALTGTLLTSVLAMLSEMILILYLGSTKLLNQLSGFLFFSSLAVLIFAGFLYRKSSNLEQLDDLPDSKQLLNLKDLFKLAGFITLLFIAVDLARRFLGSEAILGVSFIGGLFELHGLTLVTSQMLNSGSLSMSQAESALLAALVGALVVSKFSILWISGDKVFARQAGLKLAAVWFCGMLGQILYHFVF